MPKVRKNFDSSRLNMKFESNNFEVHCLYTKNNYWSNVGEQHIKTFN